MAHSAVRTLRNGWGVGGGRARNGVEVVSTKYDTGANIPLPGGIKAGDLIVAYIGNDSLSLPAVPPGYSSVETEIAATAASLRVVSRVADGTESIIGTTGSSTRTAILVVRGASGVGLTAKNNIGTTVVGASDPGDISQGSLLITGNNSNTGNLESGIFVLAGASRMVAVTPDVNWRNRGWSNTFGGTYRFGDTSRKVNITVEVLAR